MEAKSAAPQHLLKAKLASSARPSINLIAKRTHKSHPAQLRGRVIIDAGGKVHSDLLNRFDALQDAGLMAHAFDLDSNDYEDPTAALLIVSLARWGNTAVGSIQKSQNMAMLSREVAKEAAKLQPGQEWHGWWVLVLDPKEEGQALPSLDKAYFIPDGGIRTRPKGPGTFFEQGDNMTPPDIRPSRSDKHVYIIEHDVIRKE
jgi:hypothetical protein